MAKTKKVCSYCAKEKCGCGKEDYIEISEEFELNRGGPWFYNGYIYYLLYQPNYYGGGIFTWVFYQGTKFIDKISITRNAIDQLLPTGVDPMPVLIWPLLETAQGNQEFVEIKYKSLTFRITHYVDLDASPWDEIESINGIEVSEMIKMMRNQERETQIINREISVGG